MMYIQAAGDKNTGFILEYQLGSTDMHFVATVKNIPLEQIERAFISFRDRDVSWGDAFQFTQTDRYHAKPA